RPRLGPQHAYECGTTRRIRTHERWKGGRRAQSRSDDDAIGNTNQATRNAPAATQPTTTEIGSEYTIRATTISDEVSATPNAPSPARVRLMLHRSRELREVRRPTRWSAVGVTNSTTAAHAAPSATLNIVRPVASSSPK